MKQFLTKAERILILTHISPDGDAMGSSLAMYQLLLAMGKTDIHIIVPNAYPDFFRWMPYADTILVYEDQENMVGDLFKQADSIICLDFNEPKRVGKLGDLLIKSRAHKLLIDHHLYPADFAELSFSVPTAPSTCQLLYTLLKENDLLHQLDIDGLSCLYTGMMTDTGNFSYNSNHPEIYLALSDLVSKGVNKDQIYQNIFNNYSADRMRFMGYCLYKKMRVFPENKVALITISRQEILRFNFKPGDAEGIVNLPLQIADVRYSVFMREDKDKIKISFRSQGNYPINTFAHECFGGGGHINAAGGESYTTLEEAIQIFMNNYKKYLI